MMKLAPAPDFKDPFAPKPKSKRLVQCLHCGERYEERLVAWREAEGDWLWRCRTIGCDGAGVGFDILPVPQLSVD